MQRREHREEERSFLVEGVIAVRELLDAGGRVRELFVRDALPHSGALIDRAQAAGAEVFLTNERVVTALSDTKTPQGVVAVADMPDTSLPELSASNLVLVLAALRDPGNAGTLVRTAAAAGADAVIFTEGAVDPFHPKTVRACAGALLTVPVVVGAALEQLAEKLHAHDFRLVGAHARARTAAYDYDMNRAVAIVLGNEAWGLPLEKRHLVDDEICIPMPGRAESLNVAIAGSLVLFEVVRQRRERTN